MKFQVDTISIEIFPLNNTYELQKLFEDSKDYIELIEGRLPQADEAADLLQTLPPGKTLKDKFVLGVYEKDLLIGVIDLIKDYPEENIWFIGLLLLSPEYRNKGLGHKIYNKLKNELISLEQLKAIRISVSEQNTQALDFWRELGFTDLYSKKENRGDQELNFMYLEDKF